MELLGISPESFLRFILILFRVSAVLFLIPFFGAEAVPAQLKIGLSAAVSLALYPAVGPGLPEPPKELLPLLPALASELTLGMVLGLAVRAIFAAVDFAAQMVGFQMGFAIVNVIDPQTQHQTNLMAQFENLLALMFFLAVDGHHLLLRAVAESFRVLPPFGLELKGELFHLMMRIASDIFVLAIKLSAPALLVLMFSSVALGVVARTVPQMNIFQVGFPLKITLGILALGLGLPAMGMVYKDIFSRMGRDLFLLMRAM